MSNETTNNEAENKSEDSKPWKEKAKAALARQGQFLTMLLELPELKLTPANVEKGREALKAHAALAQALSARLDTLAPAFVPANVRNREGVAVGDKVQLKPAVRAVFPMADKVGVVMSIRASGKTHGRGTVKFAEVKVGQQTHTFYVSDLMPAAV